ncbi:MAG: hypothetical protein MJH11_12745, partial [Lentisphaeria bacterium]|nr:hypothetical protein [Lentisphaeria bacterium]
MSEEKKDIGEQFIKTNKIFVLREQKFENVTFGKFSLSHLQGQVFIENVKFINCEVQNGFWIRDHVTMKNVLFENIKCGSDLEFKVGACLDNVKITGKKTKELICRKIFPEDIYYERPEIDVHFDISEFD